MGLSEPQMNQRQCEPETRAPRRPLTTASRVTLLAIGLLIGGILAFSRQSSSPAAPNGPLSPQSVLHALMGASDEERILFSATPTEPTRAPDLLPAGIPMVYAFYRIPGATAGASARAQWSRNGVVKGQIPVASITPGNHPGEGTIAFRAPADGFAPGVYEVEVQQGPNKVRGSFVTAVGAGAIIGQPAPKDAEVAIPKVAFADGVDAHGQPQRVRKTFYGTDRIFFAFRYTQAEPGSTVRVSWYGGQEPIKSAEREVLLPSVEGWAHAWLQAPFPGLPPGEYRATVTMSADTRAIATGSFTVTAGAAPVPPAAR